MSKHSKETLLSILDNAASMPGGSEKLRKMANRWFDRSHNWNSEYAEKISVAATWRSIAIAKREVGHIDEALRYEQYSDTYANQLARIVNPFPEQ